LSILVAAGSLALSAVHFPWLPSRATRHPLDQSWLNFRDAYGLVWAVRVQEQFNSAAAHAGLDFRLRWPGIRPQPGSSAEAGAAADLLTALLKRFV
jgi:hypothetical protein